VIDVNRHGSGVKIQFNPIVIEDLINFAGFIPVIINIAPIKSIMPLLGLDYRRKEDILISSIEQL